MISLLGLALAYAGFTAVCLASDRYQRKVWRQPLAGRTATWLRIGGFALLALALVPCAAGNAGSNGVLLWLGLLTAAGVTLIFLLPFAPRFAAGLAVAAAAGSAVLAPSMALAQAAGVNYVDRTKELREPHTASVQSKPYRTDTVEIELGPISLGILEYKVTMAAGDTLVYSWESPEDVHVEFHGHTDPALNPVMDVVFYDITDGKESRGAVTAPMAGMHGWYLQNPSFETFKVKLTIAGFYELGPGLRTPMTSPPPAAR